MSGDAADKPLSTLALLPDARGDTALGLAIRLKYKHIATMLVEAAAARGRPTARAYVAQRDLVPLVREYPALAKKLLDGVSRHLEPSGARTAFHDERALIGGALLRSSNTPSLTWHREDPDFVSAVQAPRSLWHRWHRLVSRRERHAKE